VGFRAWLRQLIADALVVWKAPGSNRPVSGRLTAQRELTHEGRPSSKRKGGTGKDRDKPESDPSDDQR
jgi:hypothetical protein